MFTIEQIHLAHDKVRSGADFPKYINELKSLGVLSFETWVNDRHTRYFGRDDYQTRSNAQYALLEISGDTDKTTFEHCLKAHQDGQTVITLFVRTVREPE